ITIRPNTARELNLFVRHAGDDARDLTVQLLDAKGQKVAVADLKKAPKKSYTRVKFVKPAPPAPVPGAPVPPPVAAPMPMGPPPPTGADLVPAAAGKFPLRLRIIDATAIEAEWTA